MLQWNMGPVLLERVAEKYKDAPEVQRVIEALEGLLGEVREWRCLECSKIISRARGPIHRPQRVQVMCPCGGLRGPRFLVERMQVQQQLTTVQARCLEMEKENSELRKALLAADEEE